MNVRIAAAVAALLVGILVVRKILQTPTATPPSEAFVVTHHVDLEQVPDPEPAKMDVPPPPRRSKAMLVEVHFPNTHRASHARYGIFDGAGLPVSEDDIPTDGTPVSLVLSPDHYDVRIGGDTVQSFDLRYRREDKIKVDVALPKRH